jgi:hypothetical protein
MEVCYWALLFMPLVILHHLLNVFVQLANKRGFKQKKKIIFGTGAAIWSKTNFEPTAHHHPSAYMLSDSLQYHIVKHPPICGFFLM